MPQYQGMWTAQKAAQLQGQQQWVNDPQFDNTVLLLQADNAANGAQNNTFLDSSANAFTITPNNNPLQGSFTPFSQAPGWWSVYNSGGASGGLLITDNVVLRPNTNNFTLEFWINFSSLTSIQSVFSKGGTSSNQLLIRTDSGTGTLLVIVSGTTIITASASSSVGAWDHYALVRSGNNWTLYRNGVSVGTATNSTSISTTANIEIGSSSVFNSMTGYISNLRFTIGAALYTSSFTPSSIPLTTTSQGASATQVELLTCQSNRPLDNSTNNFAVTPTTNTSIQAFSPFAPQYQYTQDVIGGSGYFDGNDFLTYTYGPELAFGTGDFTVEFWMYPSSTNLGILQGAINSGWGAAIVAGTFYWQSVVNQTNRLITNVSAYLNFAWRHWAIVRSGGTLTLYIDGQSIASIADSTNYASASGTFNIGQYPAVGSFVTGYLSGLRVVKGTAVYTAAFTPPTAPPTAITNTSLLLNFTNAAIFDGAMKNNLETAGNAQVSTTVVKYGAGSMFFDGTDDYIVAPYSPLFNFGTGPFTIECWVNFTTLSGNRIIFDTYTAASAGGGYQLYWRSTGTSITFYANGVVVAQSSFTAHVTNVWYHVAVTRDTSNVVRIFVDGTQYASATYATAIDMATTGKVAVGIQASTLTNDLAGYVDDLRVTKGVARYTANFTPPQVALQRQ